MYLCLSLTLEDIIDFQVYFFFNYNVNYDIVKRYYCITTTYSNYSLFNRMK